MVGKSIAAYGVDYDRERYAASTEALLELLRQHHDYSVAAPEGWQPTPKAPEPVRLPEQAPVQPIYVFVFAEQNFQNRGKFDPKIAAIQGIVADYFKVTKKDICSARRTREVVHPRQVAYYLAKKHTLKSLPEIGRRFGGRDHTTILHGVRKIESEIKTDWTVAYDVAHLEAML